jgi:histidine ammonia-lyase
MGASAEEVVGVKIRHRRGRELYLSGVKTLAIGADGWTTAQVWEAADQPEHVALSDGAREAIRAAHRVVLEHCASGAAVYGVNTGFGDLASVPIASEDLAELQRRLLVSHACGVGDPVPERVVRTMLLLKVVGLSRGHSGVAEATVDRLLLLLTRGALPVVPSQGSLGASGDLAPLAHLVLPLIGVGDVMVGGERRAAQDVLAGWGLEPLVLGPKEGLALINGTQLMAAYGVESARRMHRIAMAADTLAALSLEAWHGRSEPFSEAIHRVRPHPGAAESARVVRSWLAGSRQQTEPRTQVQDPYSFRCVPQVHGASRDVLAHALTVLDRELQGVTDNPLVFPETGEILSGGNFHGQPLALTLEAMALATHEWASISERRTFKLLAGRQGLPPFLAAEPGLNSGLMIPQYTAASLVSQNKHLCMPAAADTIDSSNGQEDHVSMGANSALKLWRILDNAEQVLAIECLTAAQALDLRGCDGMAPALHALHTSFRRRVPFLREDAFLAPHLAAALDWFRTEADWNPPT